MPEPGPLERSFKAFHQQNPWVYMRLVQLCFKLKNAGVRKYSMRTIIAVLRFETGLLALEDEEGSKITFRTLTGFPRPGAQS